MNTVEMPESAAYPVTPRNRVKRRHDRGRYDRETVHAILDAGLLCHVAYVVDGQPYCTPTAYWREGEEILWHGSSASRMLRAQAGGIDVCLTVSHIDSLVLTRSAFGHSINYRSAMVYGRARLITDPDEKLAAAARFVDRIYPGRSSMIRPPSPQELKATAVVRMPIEQASGKIRSLPPLEDRPEDYDLPVWSGLIPVRQTLGAAETCERLVPGVGPGEDLARYREGAALDELLAALAYAGDGA